MEIKQMFSIENYFGKYELIVREEIGKQLDDFKHLISQIENECTVRIMNIDFNRPNKRAPITVENLITCDKDFRCKTLAAFLYNDALWKLESAHMMICLGLLNIAYANMRMSMETLVEAFIVERMDTEAIKFLQNKDVDPKKIESFIPSDYNDLIVKMKKVFANWGVHTNFESVQLTSLFGPSRFDKMISKAKKVKKPLTLPEGFSDVAQRCIQQVGQVGILFTWLMSMPVK